MTMKTLILGAAAGTLAVAGAQAADLPAAPEPVDYVRVCDAYGTGFFYIPGTETCLRIKGGVRAEFRFRDFASNNTNWGTRDGNATTTRARAYVRFDSRTATEYGLLRTYVDVWFTGDTGSGSSPSSIQLWNAFIQFGGFTFGRTESFFDFYTGDAWGAMVDQGFSDHRANVFAYTYGFGNGLSASLSIEDASFSRGTIEALVPAVPPVNLYGGHKIPDFVANLRVDQGWGSAQIMGVTHQVWGNDTVRDSALGWAVGAGVTFNAPMIAAGDTISFQAAYAHGATAYVNSGLSTDAVATTATNLDLANVWGIGGGITHHWTPTLSTALSASYASLDAFGTQYDVDRTSIQGNLVWSPVSGFLMGVELEYANQDFGVGGTDDDDLVGLFRVQRTF